MLGPACTFQCKRDMGILERAQWRAMDMAKGLELLSHRENWANWKSLASRRESLWWGHIVLVCINIYCGGGKKMEAGSFQCCPVEGQGTVAPIGMYQPTGAVSWAPLHKTVQYCHYGFYFHTALSSMLSLYDFLGNLLETRSLSFLISKKKPISKKTAVLSCIVRWMPSMSREVWCMALVRDIFKYHLAGGFAVSCWWQDSQKGTYTW